MSGTFLFDIYQKEGLWYWSIWFSGWNPPAEGRLRSEYGYKQRKYALAALRKHIRKAEIRIFRYHSDGSLSKIDSMDLL